VAGPPCPVLFCGLACWLPGGSKRGWFSPLTVLFGRPAPYKQFSPPLTGAVAAPFPPFWSEADNRWPGFDLLEEVSFFDHEGLASRSVRVTLSNFGAIHLGPGRELGVTPPPPQINSSSSALYPGSSPHNLPIFSWSFALPPPPSWLAGLPVGGLLCTPLTGATLLEFFLQPLSPLLEAFFTGSRLDMRTFLTKAGFFSFR